MLSTHHSTIGKNVRGTTTATMAAVLFLLGLAGEICAASANDGLASRSSLTTVAGSDDLGTAQLNLNQAAPGVPIIQTQPGNTMAVAGGSAVFSVAATGTGPLQYQWWVDDRVLAWATGSTLTLTNLQPSNAGRYRVVVSNSYGSTSSGWAVLTVGPAWGGFPWVAIPVANGMDSFGGGVAVDAEGNLYLCGMFSGTLSFGPTNLTSVTGPFGPSTDMFVARYTRDGVFNWVRHMGGAQSDSIGGISLQPSGDLFITGTFYGSAQFGNGNNITASSVDHAFVLCLGTNGALRWVRAETSGAGSSGNAIAASPWGDVYVAGRFEGTANFGGVALSSTGSGDIFLVRYRASDGGVEWGVSAGNSSSGDSGKALAVWPGTSPAESAVYLGGYFSGYTVFTGVSGFGGVAFSPVGGSGEFDGFLARFSRVGELDWAQRLGSSSFDSVNSVAVDSSGNVVAGGIYGDTLLLGETNLPPFGGLDGFVMHLGADGRVNWVRSVGGPDFDDVDGVALDAQNNIYFTGGFGMTAEFSGTNVTSAGAADAFLAHYTHRGGRISVLRMGGPDYDYSTEVATGPGGIIVATGAFSGTASFDTITLTGTSAFNPHFYMARGRSNSPPGAPYIWRQPQNTEVRAGERASMTVGFSGGPATFQWFRNGLSIPGANSPRLDIDSASLGDEGLYRLQIQTAAGTITSSEAELSVIDPNIRVGISVGSPQVDEAGNTKIVIEAYAENAQGTFSTLAIYDGTTRLFVRPFNVADHYMTFTWSEPPLGTHCLRAVATDEDEFSNPRTNSTSAQCVTVVPQSALGFASAQVSTLPSPPEEFSAHTVFGSVRIQNLTTRPSAPLRVRVHRSRSFFFLPSQTPSFIPDPEDVYQGFEVNRPGGLAAGETYDVSIPSSASILCPQFEEFEFGSGLQYHILAVLEEFVGGKWVFVDRAKLFSSIIKIWFPFNEGAIGIDPLPTTNTFAFLTNLVIVAPATIPEGQSINLVAVGALSDGSTGTVAAAWSSSFPTLAPDGLFQVPLVAADQTVNVTATYQRRTTRSATRALTILDLGEAPQIAVPPAAQVVALGSTASFGVQATGTAPLSFQWLFNGTNVLTGRTEATLTLNNVQAAQAGLYSVIVSNRAGSVISAPVNLTVLARPALSTPTALVNGSFRFIIHGEAGNQWALQSSEDLKNWTTLSNITLNASSMEIIDPAAGQTSRRFFKLRSIPPP